MAKFWGRKVEQTADDAVAATTMRKPLIWVSHIQGGDSPPESRPEASHTTTPPCLTLGLTL